MCRQQWILYKDVNEGKEPNKGFRVIPEARFYLPSRKEKYHLFLAAQVSYKRVKFEEGYIVPQQTNYEKLVGIDKVKQMVGSAIRFGYQNYTHAPISRRIFFEASVGLGFKYKWSKLLQTPPENSRKEGYSTFNTSKGLFPDVPIYVRLGYRF